jgi:hypothetical protein
VEQQRLRPAVGIAFHGLRLDAEDSLFCERLDRLRRDGTLLGKLGDGHRAFRGAQRNDHLRLIRRALADRLDFLVGNVAREPRNEPLFVSDLRLANHARKHGFQSGFERAAVIICDPFRETDELRTQRGLVAHEFGNRANPVRIRDVRNGDDRAQHRARPHRHAHPAADACGVRERRRDFVIERAPAGVINEDACEFGHGARMQTAAALSKAEQEMRHAQSAQPRGLRARIARLVSREMAETLTPMMQQYHGIRRTLPPDTLLLFRLGDFYEMFFDDAKEAAGILNVALTKRNGVPMCGIPHHAQEGYIRRLIKAGKRVAICDQIERAAEGADRAARDHAHRQSRERSRICRCWIRSGTTFSRRSMPAPNGGIRLCVHRSDDRRFSADRTGGRSGTRRRTRARPAHRSPGEPRRQADQFTGDAGRIVARDGYSVPRTSRPIMQLARAFQACSRSMASAAPKCTRRRVRRARFCNTSRSCAAR